MSFDWYSVLPPNPFVAGDTPVEKPDLRRFLVPDGYLIEALQFYEKKQQLRDGFGWWVIRCADPNSSSGARESIEATRLQLLKEEDELFKPTEHTPTDADHRRPASITAVRGLVSEEERRSRIGNSRNWLILVQLNREHSAPRLMDWFEKEGVRQLRNAFREMAHFDMRGSLAYTEAEAKASFLAHDKQGEELRAFCRKTLNWEKETVARAKERQQPSDRTLRSRLLGLAYYRYRQAGYKWRAYARDAETVGLESDLTEKTSTKRLKVAAARQKELWAIHDDIPNPHAVNGINLLRT